MNIVASSLVALSLFDFLSVSPASVIEPTSSYAQKGTGELTIQRTDADGVGSVPKGATRVPVAVLTLIASCDADISLESMELRHAGLGSTADIQSVYLSDDSRRLTRAQRFGSKGTIVNVRFLRPFVIHRCDAQKLVVHLDISRSADIAGEHRIEIVSGGVLSSAKVVTIDERASDQTVVTTPFQVGSLSVRFLPTQRPLQYGRRQTVARLQITTDAKQSHLLTKILLTNNGSARDMNLLRFTVEKSDGVNLIAPATRMHGRTVVLEFSPSFPISRGQTVVFSLVADVRTRYSDTVDFALEEPSDLVAIPSNLR